MSDNRYRYMWKAYLADGSVVDQFAVSSKEPLQENHLGDLDFQQVHRIDLIPQEPGHPPVSLRVNPTHGEKAIKFWQVDVDSNTGKTVKVSEVVGIQKNVAGHAVKFFVLVQPDGGIIVSTKTDY